LTVAAAVLALFALLLLAWSYAVYPALVFRIARKGGKNVTAVSVLPSVEVVVAAFDEESVIGGRVANLLAQNYGGRLLICVGCDGCRDATAEGAREAGEERVHVREFAVRRGKAAVVNDLVAGSEAEVLVFTDANSQFLPDAVARLVEPFGDPEVGAVCGRLLLTPPDGTASTPETEFWDRETRLKEAEGMLGVCLGANGAIYAARRALVRPLPEDTALDDFLIPARIAGAGKKVVFAGGAVAREHPGGDIVEESGRRFRIGIGAGQVMRRERWLFDYRRHPLLSFVFVSRKAARWLAPVVALSALVCALFAPLLSPAAAAIAAALLLLSASAPLRLRLTGWSRRLYYFGVINLALAAGVVAGLAGYRRPAWKRTGR